MNFQLLTVMKKNKLKNLRNFLNFVSLFFVTILIFFLQNKTFEKGLSLCLSKLSTTAFMTEYLIGPH